MSEQEIVKYALKGPVATLTIDDGKANALSPALLKQLAAAAARAQAEAKAVVLVGRDGVFSAGFDLKIMMSGPKAARDLVLAGGEVLLQLYDLPLPVVVACTGHAIAGGVLLAATGDVRIGAAGPYKLGLNEVGAGMPVPILAHEFARDRLLPSELFASVVQAKIYDPEAAVRAGWLDRVVAAEGVLAAAEEEALRLAALPGAAYGISKRSLRKRTITYIRDNTESNLAELLFAPK